MLLLTSKGAAGVTGSGFIVLAATLSAVGHVPVAGLALILGIDRFMSEARALTNLIGNGVATMVVAKWTGDLDTARMRRMLDSETADEAEEPEAVLDRHPAHLGAVRLDRAAPPPPSGGGRSAPRREALRENVLLLYKHPAFADNRRTLRRPSMDMPVKALNTEKAKALQAALAQIEKQFGKGTIMRLGEGEVLEDIQVVSTGSLGLDIALGVGGLPRGRVVEIYGPESSGKTTLTLQVIAEMQKLGGTCAFIDAEHALDVQYAQKLGVNLSGPADLASPTPASRRSRSSTRWCARARST